MIKMKNSRVRFMPKIDKTKGRINEPAYRSKENIFKKAKRN